MLITNWLRLLQHRLWFHNRVDAKVRPRRRPIGLARNIDVYEDRTLLSAVAVDDGFMTGHGQPVSADVSLNDDLGGGGASFSEVSGPAHGTLSVNADGTLVYTPDAQFVGTDQFIYAISDGTSSDEGTVTIDVLNSPPSAEDDSFFTSHNQSLYENVATNDFDGGDGDPVTYSVLAGPAHGSLTLNSDGTFEYTPAGAFVGSDQFTYEIIDGFESGSAIATISVMNAPPTAEEDWFFAPRGETIMDTVAANDFDGGDGDPVTYSLLDDVLNGVVMFNPDGTFEYTSETSFVGSEQFRYQISDGIDSSSTVAHINVFGDPANGDVDAVDDSYTIHHDWPLIDTVATNDTLPADGGGVQFTLVDDVAHGQLTLQPDGYFVYTPDQHFVGSDQFAYRLSSGTDSDEAVVTIEVINSPPTANNAAYEIIHDRSLEESLDSKVNDPDGDPLTFSVKTPPEHGTLTLNADGTFIYQPDWL